MNSDQSDTHCSNQMGQIYLRGMEEILGGPEMRMVLDLSRVMPLSDSTYSSDSETLFTLEQTSQIQNTIEQIYGPLSGRGIALRSGRASFHYELHEFGAQMGLTEISYRLQPTQIRLKAGLEMIARITNENTYQCIQVEEDHAAYRWIVENCPWCRNRHEDSPICHQTVGLLQEFLYWASSGKNYHVKEIECIAQGAQACVFLINKQPFE